MKKVFGLALIIVMLFSMSTCKKDSNKGNSGGNDNNNNNNEPGLPVVKTVPVVDITNATATCGGEISSDGGSSILEKGICWSTGANPVITDNKTNTEEYDEAYSCILAGMTRNTKYNVRAYAINSKGIGYGSIKSFKTTDNDNQNYAILETYSISNISETTAKSGGSITTTGDPITGRGVCWSTSINPTISGSKSIDGFGPGSFTSSLSGLTSSTTYYVRAYATNAAGTAYGKGEKFSTNGIPKVYTSSNVEIYAQSATCGGSISSDGGFTIEEQGICWSTSSDPTINSSKLSESYPSSYGFSFKLIPLTPNTTYYYRAYAKNSSGLAYGKTLSFKTTALLAIGQTYGGGIIAFIIRPTDGYLYIEGEQHGLIVAPTDQSKGIQWYNGYYSYNNTYDFYGEGRNNTWTIVDDQGDGNYAAKLCTDLDLGGFTDWYLPSTDEMSVIYVYGKSYLGFDQSLYYWTSMSYDNYYALALKISDATYYKWRKDQTMAVRAIRDF